MRFQKKKNEIKYNTVTQSVNSFILSFNCKMLDTVIILLTSILMIKV